MPRPSELIAAQLRAIRVRSVASAVEVEVQTEDRVTLAAQAAPNGRLFTLRLVADATEKAEVTAKPVVVRGPPMGVVAPVSAGNAGLAGPSSTPNTQTQSSLAPGSGTPATAVPGAVTQSPVAQAPAPSTVQPPQVPVTEVIRVQNADLAPLARLLLSTFRGVRIQVDESSRSLIITAPPVTIAQMRPVIQQLDVRPPSALTTEVLKLRAADAQAVAGALRQALPSVQVYADAALGAVVLQGESAQVERARGMVATLDQPIAAGGVGVRTEVIVLKHVPPSEFAQDPATGRLADDIAQSVQNALQTAYPDLRVAVDRRQQAVIVTGGNRAVDAARELIAKLDVPSPQVALEVRVVEVAANALRSFGIQLSPVISTTFTETDPNNRAFVFGRTPLNITGILNALSEQGSARILANPAIATVDGRRAFIRTGDDIPLVVRQIIGSTVLENVVTFRAGVTLDITPKISGDGTITTILKPQVSTFTGTTAQGAPQISVREVQTTISVRDGDTIVIGGLLEERDLNLISKVPFLGDLPILGSLFRSERREVRRTELIITVTPKILPFPSKESGR